MSAFTAMSFYCNDSADNWNRTVSRMFSLDRIAPGITILSPSVSRNYSATSILFNISTNENATCFYSLDSGVNNVSMQRNATDTGFNDTNNSIVNGAYTVNFYCNDTLNNWNRTQSRAFIMDTVAPALTFSCTPASVSQGNAVTCSCSATDATSGINTSYAVNGLSFTASPPTTSSGTQTTTCSSVDYAGNTVSLSTTYTVETSGGGGGGGGGGGTTSATVTKTLDSESKVVAVIVEATPVTVTITKSDSLGVSEISIESTEKIENVKVSVDKLSGQPATVSTAPVAAGGSSGVYSYLKIEAPQASGKIKDADITFDVKKSWIAEKGINAKDVVLQRYTTKWTELPTTLLSENAEKATYKATTPGFSFFAVTAKSNATAVTPAANVTEEVAPAAEGGAAEKAKGISLWVWVIIALAIIVIILVSIKAAAKKKR
ncbi:PGF-pre-PGF domain-containing protein [Candidatus Pacearchaeota archaeon]|nr:PGF-pre-PGF domain-containing protein [Candidatus Pacearchaeota archaeon]